MSRLNGGVIERLFEDVDDFESQVALVVERLQRLLPCQLTGHQVRPTHLRRFLLSLANDSLVDLVLLRVEISLVLFVFELDVLPAAEERLLAQVEVLENHVRDAL